MDRMVYLQDLILNTIAATHEVASYVNLLDTNGHVVQLGLVAEPHSVSQIPLVFARRYGPPNLPSPALSMWPVVPDRH